MEDLMDLSFLDEDFCEKSIKSKKTSDTLKKKAKEFLFENNIRQSIFTESDFLIINNVLTDLRLPKKKQQLRIRTQQQINLISIVFKIIEIHKKIDELTISTYTFNRKSLNSIIDLVKGKKILKFNLLLSSSYSFRDAKYLAEVKELMILLSKKNHISFSMVWSHFKITLIKCGSDYYQHEGSMNYSTNNMAEQIVFENNKKNYDYDYEFLTKIIFDKKLKSIERII